MHTVPVGSRRHESFHADNAGTYTRPWFAWANSLFGELILQLAEERPHLLGMPRLARSTVPPPTSAAAAWLRQRAL